MDDLISRQAALDAMGERPLTWTGGDYELGCRNQYDTDRLAIETVPPVTPKQRTDTIKAEIKRIKRSFTVCINSDYYTGYMSALSAVEGFIAQLEGKE